jgi:galactose mutarotase-like enzyme
MTSVQSDWNRRVLQNSALRVEVLPALGGKVSSLSLVPEGGEFLQGPLKPYAERTATTPFDESDGSGWDECLPTVGPSQIAFGSQTATLKDHGDLWRLPWTVEDSSDTSLALSVEADSLPLRFTRRFTLDGSSLIVDYSVTNTGSERVPYGWSIHPLFAIEPFDRIVLPDSVKEVKGTQTKGRLGTRDRMHAWPVNAEGIDLSLVGMAEDDVADKLLLPSPAEGWCALERIGLRARLRVEWNPSDWPWLGLWICYGGWPDAPGAKKGYTVAIEPCNLPVDSLSDSLETGAGSYLDGGATRSWQLRVRLEKAEER